MLIYIYIYTYKYNTYIYMYIYICIYVYQWIYIREIQGGEDSQDPLSLQVNFRKSDLFLAALLWKMICNLWDPMSLRYPVRESHTAIKQDMGRCVIVDCVGCQGLECPDVYIQIYIYMYVYIYSWICIRELRESHTAIKRDRGWCVSVDCLGCQGLGCQGKYI